MLNETKLIGRVGKDPEVRRLESGVVVANFSVATSESYLDKKTNEWQEIVEWHNVQTWRNVAESVERNIKKGMLVYVNGKNVTTKWTDKQGNDRYQTNVVARQVRRLSFDQSQRVQQQQQRPVDTMPPPNDMPADDLPF